MSIHSPQLLYTFVHASDPHFATSFTKQWEGADQRVNCFLADIQALQPQPRFILMTGDICNNGNSHPEDLTWARDTLAKLSIPVYMIPGNHDLATGNGELDNPVQLPPIEQTSWYQQLGDGGLFWVRREKPLEFIGIALRNGDPEHILTRLEQHLKQPTDYLRIVVCHYPLYPVREGGTLLHWGSQHIVDSVQPLRHILHQHQDSIVAYLFGHVHALTTQVVDGMLHASGGALSVGAPGYRVFSVYTDRLVSQFYPISDASLAKFGFWGSASDQDHPSVEIYHVGTDLERHFMYRFTERKLEPIPVTR